MTTALKSYESIAAVLKTACGIVVDSGKEYLFDARLTQVLRKHEIASLDALALRLQARPQANLLADVVDAMTINETSFFRDLSPFEALAKEIVPDLLKRNAAEKTISIWCGAASTGQEPYSIAMTLKDACPTLDSWRLRVVATDICRDVLERAKSGRFTQREVNRGLPARLLAKYFRKEGEDFVVADELRRLVSFRSLNLIADGPGEVFDVVFLRNVLIYFDLPTKKRVLENVRRVMRPGGCLFLGCAETTINITDVFVRAQAGTTSCYRPA